MARQGFKRWWIRIVPPPIERSVYVLCASIALMILFIFWRPIDTIVWNVANPLLHDIIWLLFWIGWGSVLLSTFLINHFELFGLQQAWFHMRGREAEPPAASASLCSTNGCGIRSISASSSPSGRRRR